MQGLTQLCSFFSNFSILAAMSPAIVLASNSDEDTSSDDNEEQAPICNIVFCLNLRFHLIQINTVVILADTRVVTVATSIFP